VSAKFEGGFRTTRTVKLLERATVQSVQRRAMDWEVNRSGFDTQQGQDTFLSSENNRVIGGALAGSETAGT
jgi:hypothetical protein